MSLGGSCRTRICDNRRASPRCLRRRNANCGALREFAPSRVRELQCPDYTAMLDELSKRMPDRNVLYLDVCTHALVTAGMGYTIGMKKREFTVSRVSCVSAHVLASGRFMYTYSVNASSILHDPAVLSELPRNRLGNTLPDAGGRLIVKTMSACYDTTATEVARQSLSKHSNLDESNISARIARLRIRAVHLLTNADGLGNMVL
jgi:hypothetical protein